MTKYQIEQYNIRYEIDDYFCPHGKRAVGIAHRIAKTKTNYKIYGKDVIDHNFNLVPYCDLDCNASVNIGMNKGKSILLSNLIFRYKDMNLTIPSRYITDLFDCYNE